MPKKTRALIDWDGSYKYLQSRMGMYQTIPDNYENHEKPTEGCDYWEKWIETAHIDTGKPPLDIEEALNLYYTLPDCQRECVKKMGQLLVERFRQHDLKSTDFCFDHAIAILAWYDFDLEKVREYV